MISDAYHYQEILSLDALMRYYFYVELHVTELNCNFHVCFIVTHHIVDTATSGP